MERKIINGKLYDFYSDTEIASKRISTHHMVRDHENNGWLMFEGFDVSGLEEIEKVETRFENPHSDEDNMKEKINELVDKVNILIRNVLAK